MKRPLLLLPLDDRPVNWQFPPLLAQIAGETLLTPPPELLGHFLRAGKTDLLADWLLQMAPQASAAIISLDMLAYGGLVASRTTQCSQRAALAQLELLADLKKRHPHLHISAFNVIMRLTITGADSATREAGRDIFRYSILSDQFQRLHDSSAARELKQVEARIPESLLQEYLQARQRNHAVNCAAVTLLADGIIDYLAMVQEDTAPEGLHITEQQALQKLATEYAVTNRYKCYPGTDEAAMTLLARELIQENNKTFSFAIQQRDLQAAQHPALFEDIPLVETINRQLSAAAVNFDNEATTLLAIHTFQPPQADLFEMPPLSFPSWECALATYPILPATKEIANFSTPLAIADVAYCNGGDPHLIHYLCKNDHYCDLLAYAGWNTAGNTLGTAITMAALRQIALQNGANDAQNMAQKEALFTRLLDDVLYQSVVRGWAITKVKEYGASPLNLEEMAPTVEIWINDAMQKLWGEMLGSYPSLAQISQPFTVRLPWGRLFEIAIEYKGEQVYVTYTG